MSRLVPSPGARLRCAICHEETSSESLVGCDGCGTRFHAECRSSTRACPTLGCTATFSPAEPHVACEVCWQLRPREQESCPGCGGRSRHDAMVWAARATLPERVRAWFLRATGRPYADRAALELTINLLGEGRLQEAALAADEAVRRGPYVARAFWARGRVRLAQGRTSEALIDLDRALALEPRDPELWLDRGVARAACGETAGAREDLSHALRLEPGWSVTWWRRAEVASSEGRQDDAERDLAEALRIDPWSVEAWSRRCVLRGERGDLAGALADAEKALAVGPRSAVAWNNRGWVRLLRLEELAGASADLDRALELDPGLVVALANRARVRARLGDIEGATLDGKRMTELAPDERYCWRALVSVHDITGDLLAAARVVDEARSRFGFADTDLRLARAVLLMRRGQRAAALDELRAVIDVQPRLPAAWAVRAGARWRAGDHRAALDDAEVAVMLEPGKAFPFSARGSARASLGDVAGGEADFERALANEPRDLAARARRALARTRNAQPYAAAADWGEVLRRAHEDDQPSFFAWVLLEAGRLADARALCERVVPGRPRDAATWHLLSRACAELDDAAGATAARERALALDPEAVAAWDALRSASG